RPGRLLADIAVEDVLADGGRVALGRIAVAAAAGADQAEPLSRGRLPVWELRRQLGLAVAAAVEDHGSPRTLAAAEEARRRVDGAIALDGVARWLDEDELADRAEAAPPAARAGAVLHELVAREPQRVVRLDVLNRVV